MRLAEEGDDAPPKMPRQSQPEVQAAPTPSSRQDGGNADRGVGPRKWTRVDGGKGRREYEMGGNS